MNKTKSKYYPKQVAIQGIIIVISKNTKKDHDIILSINGNESFINTIGGIVKTCRDYEVYDPFENRHGNTTNAKSYLRGS